MVDIQSLVGEDADRAKLLKLVESLLEQKHAVEAENREIKEKYERRQDRLSIEVLHLEEMSRRLKREKLESEEARHADQQRSADRFERAHKEYAAQLMPLSTQISELKRVIE